MPRKDTFVCCVGGCHQKAGNKSSLEGRNFLRFHNFPRKKPELCKLWAERCVRPATEVRPKYMLVCSDHFKDSDYDPKKLYFLNKYPDGQFISPLKPQAVPNMKPEPEENRISFSEDISCSNSRDDSIMHIDNLIRENSVIVRTPEPVLQISNPVYEAVKPAPASHSKKVFKASKTTTIQKGKKMQLNG